MKLRTFFLIKHMISKLSWKKLWNVPRVWNSSRYDIVFVQMWCSSYPRMISSDENFANIWMSFFCYSKALITHISEEECLYCSSFYTVDNKLFITPFLFYKNSFYKNHKAQICEKIKNILRIMLRLKVSNLIRIWE